MKTRFIRQIKNLLPLVFVFIISFESSSQQRLTRGFGPGEIYIASKWYEPVYYEERYDAIFFSDDYGETLSIRYVSDPFSNEDMFLGYLLTDSTAGTIYNCWKRSLFLSEDYGYSWTERNPAGNYTNQYAAGSGAGDVYIVHPWINKETGIYLKLSTDFGDNFYEISNEVPGSNPEVGTEAGELYVIGFPNYTNSTTRVYYSDNYGYSFTQQCALDSTSGGAVVYGHYPVLSRGNSPGELYLVTWHLPMNYHIHYSTDYGQTFELRYESDTMEWYHVYSFSSGTEPGSFYMEYCIPNYDGVNTILYIYHSSDTAKTFTEYEHYLDENYPVEIQNHTPNKQEADFEGIWPNPSMGDSEFSFYLPRSSDVEFFVYNKQGNLTEITSTTNFDKGHHQYKYSNHRLSPGLYHVVFRVNGMPVEIVKMIRL